VPDEWWPPLLIIALVVVMLWFAFGTQGNIRRGNQILEWLQSGLPSLGSRTTLRWLGSSAVELKIAEANDPFDSAEAVVVLEPRDVGLLWAWSRSRGRRDFVILRGRLVSPPRFEIEVGDTSSWTGGDRLKRLDESSWHSADWDDGNVVVAHTSDADPAAVRAQWKRFQSVAGGPWRLSVRRDRPHVEVHLALPDIAGADARSLIDEFMRLGGIALQR
jgi:hypothetical protein